MHVRVDQTGRSGAPMKIYDLRLLADERLDLRV